MSSESARKPNPPAQIVITSREPRRSGRAVLLAGVAGACVMGVALGLWARPGMQERQAAAAPAPEAVAAPPATTRRLQVVVDDHPLPPAAPIEVLAGAKTAPVARAGLPELLAPKRPPEGLIKAQAEIPPPAAPQSSSPRESRASLMPTITAAVAAAELAIAKVRAPAVHLAQAEPPAEPFHPAAEAHRAQHAKAESAKADAARAKAAKANAAEALAASAAAHKVELAAARDAARTEAHRLALAKARQAELAQAAADAAAEKAAAHRAEAAKAHRIELARQAQAEKAEQLRLAKAQARAKAAQREEVRLEALAQAAETKKRIQLARLAHALARAVVPHAKPAPAPVELAKAERRRAHKTPHELRVEQASLKTRRGRETARVAVPHVARARPEPLAPQPGANGLMRVSTTPRCASRDAGQAMVCADPGLSAADRQLARAYQGARAAGVSEAQLQRGQQHWLASRSAAAREAPWAVRDVYMARIAELNGQAKEAQSGY